MSPVSPSWTGRVVAAARLLFTLLSVGVLIYVVIVVYRDAQTLRTRSITLSWGPLLAGEALLLLFFALQAQGWRLTLVRLDGSVLPFSTAFSVWWLSQTTRYLPGKVLTWASRYALVSGYGVSVPTVSLSLVLEHVLTPIGAVLIFAIFSLASMADLLADWLWLVIAVVVGLCVFLYPPFLQKAMDIWTQFRRQPRVRLHLGLRDVIFLIGLYTLQWAIAGAAFVCFLAALTPTVLKDWLALIGIFPLAWTCGFLSILTPGGLGVREVALVVLLSAFLPVPSAVFVAGTSRLWWMLAEGLAFLTALTLRRFCQPQALSRVTLDATE